MGGWVGGPNSPGIVGLHWQVRLVKTLPGLFAGVASNSASPSPPPHTAAVLESGAFGPWTPPDYKALAAASPAEYAAMREATRAPGGGAGASPAVAALPPPPMVKTQPTIKEEEEEGEGEEEGEEAAVKQEPAEVKQEGPPATPAGAKVAAGGEREAGQHSAAVAAALASPPPTPAQIAVEKRVADWLEQVLLPAINRQVWGQGVCW